MSQIKPPLTSIKPPLTSIKPPLTSIKPPLTSYADPSADSGLGITVKDQLGQEINPFDLVQLVNSLAKQLKGARQRAKRAEDDAERAEDDAEYLRDQIVRAKVALGDYGPKM